MHDIISTRLHSRCLLIVVVYGLLLNIFPIVMPLYLLESSAVNKTPYPQHIHNTQVVAHISNTQIIHILSQAIEMATAALEQARPALCFTKHATSYKKELENNRRQLACLLPTEELGWWTDTTYEDDDPSFDILKMFETPTSRPVKLEAPARVVKPAQKLNLKPKAKYGGSTRVDKRRKLAHGERESVKLAKKLQREEFGLRGRPR